MTRPTTSNHWRLPVNGRLRGWQLELKKGWYSGAYRIDIQTVESGILISAQVNNKSQMPPMVMLLPVEQAHSFAISLLEACAKSG